MSKTASKSFYSYFSLTKPEADSYYCPLTQEDLCKLYYRENIGDISSVICYNYVVLNEYINKLIAEINKQSGENSSIKDTLKICGLDLDVHSKNYECIVTSEESKTPLSEEQILKILDFIKNINLKSLLDLLQVEDDQINKIVLSALQTIKCILQTYSASDTNSINIGSNDDLSTYKNMKNRPYPSKDLIKRVVDGHLRFVFQFVKKQYFRMRYTYDSAQIEFDDLIQEALIALASAARTYIPSPIAKFTTYASTSIEHALNKVLIRSKKNSKPKPFEILEDEIKKTRYIILFYNSLGYYITKRGRAIHYDRSIYYICKKLREQIIDYNKDMRAVGKNKLLLPIFKGRYDENLFNKFQNQCETFLRESQVGAFLSNDDFNIASLWVEDLKTRNPRGFEPDDFKVISTLYIQHQYLNVLLSIKMYMKIELEEQKKQGDIPSSDELFIAINRDIRRHNRQHDPSLGYENLCKYSTIYENLFNVPLDFSGEEKALEREDLEEEGKKIYYNYEEIKGKILDSIEQGIDGNTSIILIPIEEVICGFPLFNYTINDTSNSADNGIRMTLREASDFFDNILSDYEGFFESYVAAALEQRRSQAINIMNECNQKIITHNLSIEERTLPKEKPWSRSYFDYIEGRLIDVYNAGIFFTLRNPENEKSPQMPVEEQVQQTIFFENYKGFLSSLPNFQKAIMERLYDENGYPKESLKSIAESLGLSYAVAQRQKTIALTKLREYFKPYHNFEL